MQKSKQVLSVAARRRQGRLPGPFGVAGGAYAALIRDRAVIAPTFHPSLTGLIRPSVKDLVFHAYGAVDFRYATIRNE